MRVLMLGWDFSPRLSGGVGTACQGIANALARAKTEVVFVLPRLRGDEEPEALELVASEKLEADRHAARVSTTQAQAQNAARTAARIQARVASTSRVPFAPAMLPPRLARDFTPEVEPEPVFASAPALPSPAEALQLLAIDSPLQPYLTPRDYAQLVQQILRRVSEASSTPPRRTAAHAPGPPPTPPPAFVEFPPPAPEPVLVPLPPLSNASLAPGAAPAYGTTLLDEVERYARAVLRIATAQRFDLIHAHDWMTFPAGILAKEVTKRPLVCHFHSCEIERRGPATDPRAADPQAAGPEAADAHVRAIEQAALAAADRIVCVSHQSSRTLRASYSLEPARIRVVHNAFSPPADDGTRKQAGAPPVVLYLGRMAAQKGPEVFLEAARRVHELEPRVRFVMGGAGELFPEVVELAARLGLARAVRFTGFLSGEELARTYARADVYVLPSSAEPFGITPLEAASLGVPVIVSKQAGVTEVLRSCLRFEPGDAADLTEKILALLRRPELRRALVEQARREVKKIRWDRPARALRAIYDELVS